MSSPLQNFIAPAQERSEIWRSLLGLLLLGLATFVFILLAVFAIWGVLELRARGDGFQFLFELQFGSSRAGSLGALVLIVMLLPALWLVVRFLHKRPMKSLLGPTGRVNWRRWGTGFLVVLFAGVLSTIVGTDFSELRPQLDFSVWVLWLPLVAGALFLQTSAEELVFRGYLLQQLAARFRSRWIWWFAPSAIFGVLHWNPAVFGSNAVFVVLATTVIGIVLTDMTARSGDLSFALGVHFANNLIAMTFAAVPGQLSGFALFLHDLDPKSPDLKLALVLEVILIVSAYVIALLIASRRRV